MAFFKVAKMLTFTSLSGAAKSSRTSPLAYLLQVDDIKILLDCGSPDWCPEPSSSVKDADGETECSHHWRQYCENLKECVVGHRSSDSALSCSYRIAPSVDLVLLSHGVLAHSGLYPYAHSRWGLKIQYIPLLLCRPWLALLQQTRPKVFAMRRT
jgi:cleavage and polyadenylation specificity factor subunit 2